MPSIRQLLRDLPVLDGHPPAIDFDGGQRSSAAILTCGMHIECVAVEQLQ